MAAPRSGHRTVVTPDRYAEVLRHLRHVVADLDAGDRLPAERELAGTLGIGRAALRRVLGDLAADGLVETRHQSGTYVMAASSCVRALGGRGRREGPVREHPPAHL
ncbi:winged helix-turn-helix domain-containing protein [Pseudonocardia sp. RS010]|uniref:winged helix-turn-helix domain-containing protein n=1 Tax=Pseudonocardia sp. RS010 TaxID=3385979 RepID=UPI00399F69E0